MSPYNTRSTTSLSLKHTFKSYRLVGEYEKPWLANKAMRSTRWNDLIVATFILLGLIGAGVIGFFTVWPYRQGDVSHPFPFYCPSNKADISHSSASSTKTTLTPSTPMCGLMRSRLTVSAPAPSTGQLPMKGTATSMRRVCTLFQLSPTRRLQSRQIRCTPTSRSTSTTNRKAEMVLAPARGTLPASSAQIPKKGS